MTTGTATSNTTGSFEYFHFGAKFPLPDWYQVEESNLPEWRLTHFALIIPLPTGLISTLSPDNWIPGRFRGIKTIEIPACRKGTDLFFKPSRLSDEERDEPTLLRSTRFSCGRTYSLPRPSP